MSRCHVIACVGCGKKLRRLRASCDVGCLKPRHLPAPPPPPPRARCRAAAHPTAPRSAAQLAPVPHQRAPPPHHAQWRLRSRPASVPRLRRARGGRPPRPALRRLPLAGLSAPTLAPRPPPSPAAVGGEEADGEVGGRREGEEEKEEGEEKEKKRRRRKGKRRRRRGKGEKKGKRGRGVLQRRSTSLEKKVTPAARRPTPPQP